MKLIVIDGNSIVNRAFYGIRTLTNRDGLNTNAVYGFMNIFLKLLDDEQPDSVCVCFDLRAPTFRHEQYDGYKASRKGMPDELAEQLPVLKQVLDKMGVRRLELEGYEADDLIGTACRIGAEGNWDCLVLTGDRDSLQLVSDRVKVALVSTKAGHTVTTLFDPKAVEETYGLAPDAIVDLKGLMGDKSDDIPGVAGIGEKTAAELLRKYGTIDEIYKDLNALDIRQSVRDKLEAGRDMAALSRKLAEIDCRAPIEFDPEQARRGDIDKAGLYELFKELEFNKLIERLKLYPAPEDDIVVSDFQPAAPEQIEGPEELGRVMADMAKAEAVAVAYTAGFEAVAAAFGGRSVTASSHDFEPSDYEKFLKFLFSGEIKKIVHDTKTLLHELDIEKLESGGIEFDTQLAAYLLSPAESGYGIEKVAERYLGCKLPEMSGGGPSLISNADGGALAERASAVKGLRPVLSEALSGMDCMDLYNDIERPLSYVLFDMERAGFLIDRGHLRKYGSELESEIQRLEERVHGHAGSRFNINSTRQLGDVLFKQMELPVVKKTKTGLSTDIEVLEKLRGAHPIIEDLIEYRSLTKLKSTYVDGLDKVVAPDGRIHTSFNMTSTATGRLSSTEPNLQNIPIRQDRGAEIRRMFIAPEGYKLIDADYSQIELRILAHISGDSVMLEAFRTGEDIHMITAAQVFGVSPEGVTPLMRRHAKAVNFGIVYGISDFSLAQDIGVGKAEAKRYMDAYFEKYSGVRAYMTDIVRRAKLDGYVTTLLNRRRYIPEIKSPNYNIRSFGERVALNTPIQGTAADIIKIAMLKVWKKLKAEKLRSRLILQVHDELIVEAPDEEAMAVMKIVRQEMESAYPEIRLEVGTGMAQNWQEAH